MKLYEVSDQCFVLLPVTLRLKSIKNIQKITKSMKMVAAAKYARAERSLKPARVYGTGAMGMQFIIHKSQVYYAQTF